MQLLLGCTELGLGHVLRVIPLGKKLEERGHELFFFSGGTAYELLRKEFENVYPCTPVAWYGTSHGVMTSASLLNILLPLPRYNHDKKRLEIKSASATETVHRYYDLRKHILKIRPELIVSDGDMHALRLAYKWNIPSVYITNIIRPCFSFSPLLVPGERVTERYVKRCTRILVPDNPRYTICEYNLGDLDRMRIKEKVEFVGSFLDMTHEKGKDEHIFASIGGPLGTRAKLTRLIIPVLSRLKSASVVSLGRPADRFDGMLGNCEIHSWLSEEQRYECMRNSRIVIFSGGHGTCFEVIKHRKPSICIPTQPEQMANAKKLSELKCSVYVKTAEQLKSAVKQIEDNIGSYRKNIEKIGEYSSRFKGIDRAIEVIESIV